MFRIIEKVFKPKVTVEQIHAEFDAGEQKFQDECEKLLSELKIPTVTKIERKAEILEKCGFLNSETVKQSKNLKEEAKKIQIKLEVTKKKAKFLKELKMNYPNEKFITVNELNRICDKYGLIHAPVKNYIKDVPEKNALEMYNLKKLKQEHKEGFKQLLFLKKNLFHSDTPTYVIERFTKKGVEFEGSIAVGINNIIKDKFGLWDGREYYYNYNYSELRIEKIDKSGFFVAAPKSHFNLDGLDKKTKHGFFNVETFEVKDPVVFEYCKNDIVRIVTKWGTDDDQSYLDEGLINEILN